MPTVWSAVTALVLIFPARRPWRWGQCNPIRSFTPGRAALGCMVDGATMQRNLKSNPHHLLRNQSAGLVREAAGQQ